MDSLTSIVAMNHEGVIGCGNTLPWRLRTDMRFFKETTFGSVIVMGRKTFDSLGRKPLPGRYNVVISHHFGLFPETEACKFGSGISDGLFRATLAPKPFGSAFVIGGASMYEQFAPFVDRYLITLVDKTVPQGDTHFCPEFDGESWEKGLLFSHPADHENEASFTVYEFTSRRPDVIRERRQEAIRGARAVAEGPQSLRPRISRKSSTRAENANIALF